MTLTIFAVLLPELYFCCILSLIFRDLTRMLHAVL
jgi:hypothetical protein